METLKIEVVKIVQGILKKIEENENLFYDDVKAEINSLNKIRELIPLRYSKYINAFDELEIDLYSSKGFMNDAVSSLEDLLYLSLK